MSLHIIFSVLKTVFYSKKIRETYITNDYLYNNNNNKIIEKPIKAWYILKELGRALHSHM